MVPSRWTAATWTRARFWTLVVVGWSACLLLGSIWIGRHPTAAPGQPSISSDCLPAAIKERRPGFTAKRTLARNHLVSEEDLDWSHAAGGAQKSDFLGRYSSCAIEAGGRVIADETAALPTVSPAAGRVTYALPLDPNAGPIRGINAGSTIDIFDGTAVVARGVSVLAVQCRTASNAGCAAIIGIAPDDAPRLRAADPKTVMIVMTGKS
jgi:hypothetical protein